MVLGDIKLETKWEVTDSEHIMKITPLTECLLCARH